MKTILITGGAGFIGSHVVREFVLKYPAYKIINLDALTYAGNLENLKDIEDLPNYHFIKADIVDAEQVLEIQANKGGKKGTGTMLARKFGVSKSAVYQIWAGANWQKL